ncbi:TetR/AcrR family transcriptional regulator [Cellulomonas pakistanensis]|uniref:TetR family transcriptional regulator n=1 Tax=Cellulomonas pakistanensis TaxID=992287 RepID=A0A919U6S5_9CELL|nr:TetR/AcrR family transcriptional regulator [Cellulomonas pakistanensis]GIG37314.1 TetR family transcriptional regulator [Cellulomonas pakistanensis]
MTTTGLARQLLADPTPGDVPGSPVAARILRAAAGLFYADGIRAVSADRVIAAAEVSKVTFYRHFATKDALVVAYLTAVAAAERAALAAAEAAHPDDPGAVLRGYADVLGRESCAPGFRGCPFINAAAEYADPAHPVRGVVAEHRRWMVGAAAALLGRLGLTDPDAAAEELVILRDGAMVAGYVGGEERARAVAAALQHAGAAVVAAHRPA